MFLGHQILLSKNLVKMFQSSDKGGKFSRAWIICFASPDWLCLASSTPQCLAPVPVPFWYKPAPEIYTRDRNLTQGVAGEDGESGSSFLDTSQCCDFPQHGWQAPLFCVQSDRCLELGAARVYQSYAPGECIWCGAPSHVSPMVVAQRSGGRLAKWQI